MRNFEVGKPLKRVEGIKPRERVKLAVKDFKTLKDLVCALSKDRCNHCRAK